MYQGNFVIDMKRILLLCFLLVGSQSYGQTATTIKNAIDNTITTKTAVNSITPEITGTRMKEVVDFAEKAVKTADSNTKYVTIKRLADTAAAIRADFPAGGGGAADSTVFTTVTRLSDSLENYAKKNYTVRYVSQIRGIPLDGSSAQTPFVQPVLDSADYFGGLWLKWDVPVNAADSELRVKSNTIIEGVGLPYMRLGNHVRQPFFINYNAHATNQLDSNIVIKNFYLDGNIFNNIDSVNGYVTRDNSIICGMLFAGVKGLILDNITFYQTNAWGVALCNVDYSRVTNLTGIRDYNYVAPIDVSSANFKIGKVPLSMDLLNYRGGCEVGYADNLISNSPDDVVAINNIEYSASLGGQEYFNFDPIHDITIKNVILDSSALGVIVYSTTSPVYNILVDGITGAVQWRYGGCSSNPSAAGAIVGYAKGATKNVVFKNVSVNKIAPLPNTFDYGGLFNLNELFTLDGNVEDLELSNISLTSWDQYPSSFRIKDGFFVNRLSVSNYTEMHSKDTTLSLPRFLFEGRAKHTSFNNIQFSRAYNLPQAGKFLSTDTANNISFNGVIAYNIDTLVRVNGLSTSRVALNNIIMDSCATTGAAIDIDGVGSTVTVTMSNPFLNGTPFSVGSGAGTASIGTDIYKRVFIKEIDNNTTNNSRMMHTSTGSFIVPPTSTGAERWFGITNNAGTTIQGALSFLSFGGVLNKIALTASTGTANAGTAQLILDTTSTLVNVMRFWPNNTVGIKTAASSSYDLDISGRVRGQATTEQLRLGYDASNYLSTTVGSTGGVTFDAVGSGAGFTISDNVALSGALTATTDASGAFPVTLQRDGNGIDYGVGFNHRLKNSSGAYVDYAYTLGRISANTAGAHSGYIDWFIANAGTIDSRMTLSKEGNLAVDGTVTTADAAYNASSWDGSTEVPTKNAVRDKIEALSVGAGGYTVVNVNTTPYTVTPTSGEYVYLVDATSGAITINLPTAASNTAKYTIKKIDASANTVTIDPNSTQTVDGATTDVINFQWTSETIISNNSNWLRID